MADFELLQRRGDQDRPARPLTIYVYPNSTEDEEAARNNILNGLTDFCNQLFNSGRITDYAIYLNANDRPDLDDSGYNDHYLAFKNWYEGRYDDRVGMHLAVDSDYTGGRADGGEGREQDRTDNVTTFSIARCGVAGIQIGGSEARATAVHECLHPTINNRLSKVDDLIKDDEHQLGKVYSDGTSSPLVNNYGLSMSQYGSCSSNNSEDGQGTNLTNCTSLAVEYTADNEF